jgi:hypothetical protein
VLPAETGMCLPALRTSQVSITSDSLAYYSLAAELLSRYPPQPAVSIPCDSRDTLVPYTGIECVLAASVCSVMPAGHMVGQALQVTCGGAPAS